MVRICRFEAVHLLLKRRWLVALPVALVGASVGVDSTAVPVSLGIAVNAWDGVLATFYNAWVFRLLVVLPFVFLAGDIVVADRSSGFAWTTLTRVPLRRQWWQAKVVAVFGAALLYVTVFFAVALLTAAFRGLAMETAFSAYALSVEKGLGFYTIHQPQTPSTFFPVFISFTSLGLGAFALISVTTTLWFSSPYIPPVVAIAAVLVSHITAAYRTLTPWDLIWRLMYGWHFHYDLARAGWYLTVSLIVFGTIIFLSVVVGGRRVSRWDL